MYAGDIGPPEMPELDINQVYNLVAQENDKERAHEMQMREPPIMNRVQQIGNRIAPEQPKPNTQFNWPEPISPFQRESLNLKRDELRQRGTVESNKLDLNRDKLESTTQDKDRGRDIQQQRADIYAFKAKNPNMVLRETKGGNYTFFNPQSGETVDTGVATGSLSEEDKLELMNTNAIKQIDARGDVQRDLLKTRGEQGQALENTRGNNALTQIGARIAGQERLQDTRGNQSLAQIAARAAETRTTNAARPNRGELPNQTRGRQDNIARELSMDPVLGKFIKVNDDGSFTVTPPGDGGMFGSSGPTDEQYNQIKSRIFGNGQPTKTTLGPPADDKPPVAPAGWKYVKKPDGSGWTAVEVKGGTE